MKAPLIDIRPDHWAIVRDILQSHVPQYEVWAFGSRATWKAKEYSDLDLVVITDKPLSLTVSAALADDFSESDLPWKVDVVDWVTTSEAFRRIIERDKVVVQSAKTERVLAGDWRSLPLSSLLAEGRAISYGIVQPGLHQDAGVPIVRVTDIRGGRISVDKPLRVAQEIEARYARTRLRGGELLLTLVGTVGEAAVVPPEMEGWNVARAVAVIPVREDIGAYWLKLALNAPEAREMIFGRLNTTVQATLNLKDVAQLPILLPEKDERERISNALGTLDDKIEINRRMNETLEAIARVIFKSWFVDFDPVRAKASGEAPDSICRRLGLTPDLLALFPDRLVASELGDIPDGWEVRPAGDEFDLTMGQSPPGETYNEVGEGIPFYQGRADFEPRFPKRRVYCTAPTRFAKRGDTLVSVRAPVGDINMAGEDCAIGRGVAAIRHKTGSRYYTYQFMRGLEDVFARFEAEGTVFGSINKKDFHGIPCVAPAPAVVGAFELFLTPLDGRVESNVHESSTLAQLRDTLLPQLISGELRVPLREANEQYG